MGGFATRVLCGEEMVLPSDVAPPTGKHSQRRSQRHSQRSSGASAEPRPDGTSPTKTSEDVGDVAAEGADDTAPKSILERARLEAARYREQVKQYREEAAVTVLDQVAPILAAREAARRFVYGEQDVGKWEDEVETEGQQHVWTFKNELDQSELEELTQQMDALQDEDFERHVVSAMELSQTLQEDGQFQSFLVPREMDWHRKVQPKIHHGANLTQLVDVPKAKVNLWRTLGINALESNVVGVVLLAGGDGSRLVGGDRAGRYGFSPPVPCLDVGLLSKKSLFQLYAERIKRLQHIYWRRRVHLVDMMVARDPKQARRWNLMNSSGKTVYPKLKAVPLYIMTSEDNHYEIKEFWQSRSYFGLREHDVMFFQQESWPVLSCTGKILMKNRYQFLRRPGGSGGLFRALRLCGVLSDMRARNLEGIFVSSTDNLLARIADPVFLGYCLSCTSREFKIDGKEVKQKVEPVQVGLKTIEREDLDDRIGFFVNLAPRPQLSETLAEREEALADKVRPCLVESHEAPAALRRPDDTRSSRCKYYSGDMCQWFIRIDDDLEKITKTGVPWSIISTCSPHFSVNKASVVRPPGGVQNAYKLEQVMGGYLHSVKSCLGLHVDRAAEYAPVRNPMDAKVAVQIMSILHQRWLMDGGGVYVDQGIAGQRDSRCEVSPLVSYGGEDLGAAFQTFLMSLPVAHGHADSADIVVVPVAEPKGLRHSIANRKSITASSTGDSAAQLAAFREQLAASAASGRKSITSTEQFSGSQSPTELAASHRKPFRQPAEQLVASRAPAQPIIETQSRLAPTEDWKFLLLPMHFESAVEQAKGALAAFAESADLGQNQIRYVPRDDSTASFSGQLADQIVAAGDIDAAEKGAFERAPVLELLPATPRWLKNEENNWETHLKHKQAKLEAMMQAQADKKKGVAVSVAAIATKNVEEAGRSSVDGVRKPRSRTLPIRPALDEGDVPFEYGTARWFGREEYQKQIMEAHEERASNRRNQHGGPHKSHVAPH